MKIKPAYIIATVISILIIVWFIYGSLIRKKEPKTIAKTNTSQSEAVAPSVEVLAIRSEIHESFIELHGRSEAVKEVAVKAETSGIVVKTPVREGRVVKRGTVLCLQDVDARQAMLDQASALLRTRELEYKASQTLVEKGFRSPTQALGAAAALDGARASVKRAEIELGNVVTRAPFGGIFETQIAEIGDYLSPGEPCGLLVDLDPLIITGEATEKQIGRIKVGSTTEVKLATGQTVTGKVRLIQSRANPATRTFRIEIAVPNASGALKAGVSARLRLPAGAQKAHLIPSSILALDEDGRVGVKYINQDKRVQFSTVDTLDETSDGLWVTGLPDDISIIVKGQDYVAVGIVIRTQYDVQMQGGN